MPVNKIELVNRLSQIGGLTKKEATRILGSLIELMRSSLESGEDVMISGFEKFQVRQKTKKTGPSSVA